MSAGPITHLAGSCVALCLVETNLPMRSFYHALIAVLLFGLFLSACVTLATQTPARERMAPGSQPDSGLTPSVTAEEPAENAGGDPTLGAERFAGLSCAGCHGVTAEGQFGPSLAGTTLSFEDVRTQVRTPRDRMVAFDEATVSDQDVRHIYAWLISLPRPDPTDTVRSAAKATALARDRLYPAIDADTLMNLVDKLDEVAFRTSGTILTVEAGERFTHVRLRVNAVGTELDLVGTFDTVLARQPFPAVPGDHVTLYGVGTKPAIGQDADGLLQRLPRMQILIVRN